ncbi:hypothetical protein Tco_0848135 [Tanacetum coccineum]
MNPQENQQVVAHDEKWVPSTERVKINSTNVRLETTVQQKEETFKAIIDYTIKKVKDSDSYEFLLANKKCIVDAEVFRKILDICLRVEGEEFTKMLYICASCSKMDTTAWDSVVTTILFLISLSFAKGFNIRLNVSTAACILNTAGNGRACSIEKMSTILIDHRNERKSRRENMPFPQFIKVIISHCLSQYKSLSNLKYQHYHIIKDDGIISRLKFVRIREDYQEYRLPIPDIMLNDAIKHSKSYQMFLKYSTSQIPPKKSRDKGSQGKKTADTLVADVDVFEESDLNLVRKRLLVEECLTEVAEEEAARQVHATHARIVTESVPELARRRPSSIAFRDTYQKARKLAEDSQVLEAQVKKLIAYQGFPMSLQSSLLPQVREQFGDQFLKLSSNTSLVNTVKDNTYAEINSLLEVKIQSKVPHIQCPSVLKVPLFVISEPSVLTPVQETPSTAPVKLYLFHQSLSYHLYLNKQQHQSLHHQSQLMLQPSQLLSLNPIHSLKLLKSASEILKIKKEQDEKQNMLKYTIKRRTKESESYKKPSTTKETPKGKASSKGSKIGKSASAKEPVEEPTAEVVMDDAINIAGEDVVHDDDQPQDTLEPNTSKTPNQDWFKQPPRPPTPDPEWNKR